MTMSNYTYILRCSDGTYYTGWTNDLEKRLAAHNEGSGSKYTRGRRPVSLVYCESFDTKQEAMSREWHIKRLSRAEKETLIAAGSAAPNKAAAPDKAEVPGKPEKQNRIDSL